LLISTSLVQSSLSPGCRRLHSSNSSYGYYLHFGPLLFDFAVFVANSSASWLQAYVSNFTLFSICFEFTFAVNSTFLLMFAKLAF